MTTYTRTCEAMRWGTPQLRSAANDAAIAEQIVAWVNDNGGEARYQLCDGPDGGHCHARIMVRTVDYGPVSVEPGWYVIMGDEDDWFHDDVTDYRIHDLPVIKRLRNFRPCDPATFEAEGWKTT